LLRLRLALNLGVDRRLDFVLLAFLAMGSPVEVYGEVLSPKKRERCGDAPLCLALADRGEDRSGARTREPLWGAFSVAW
jgi:hypothetical protein